MIMRLLYVDGTNIDMASQKLPKAKKGIRAKLSAWALAAHSAKNENCPYWNSRQHIWPIRLYVFNNVRKIFCPHKEYEV